MIRAKLIATSNTSAVARNTGAMLVMQVATSLLPLVLIPYLTHVLGVEKYGVVAFGLAMVQIVCVFTDFGFSLSATYHIACARDDKSAVAELIGAVMICKTVILAIIGLVVSAYLSLDGGAFAGEQQFLLLMITASVGQTYQPTWFFMGIERMAFVTLLTLLSRVLFVASAFLLVKGTDDLNVIAVANSMSALAAALFGTLMIFRLGYGITWPGWAKVWRALRDSSNYFWSRASVMMYTSGSAFFLGVISTPVQVAHYSAAEQLYRGAQSLFGSLPQALYPHMAREKNYKLFYRALAGVVVLGLAGIVIGAFLGPWIIMRLYGPGFEESYLVLLVFLVIFAVAAPSIMLGYPFLGALGRADLANRSVILAGLLQMLMLTVIWQLGWGTAFKVAFAVLITEVMVLIMRIFYSSHLFRLSRANVIPKTS